MGQGREMSFLDMKSELAEAIPGLSRTYAGTLLNRAWRVVRDNSLWSFQLSQGGFSTPAVTTAGSITLDGIGQSTGVADSVATAAWAALPAYWGPTVQQIRANGYSIYSIIAFDSSTGIFTLDRPFVDPLPAYDGVNYQMFQAYIAAPTGFKRWLNVGDMFNCWALDIWTARRTMELVDPARLYTSDPTMVMPVGVDRRGAGTDTPSSTLGQMLYELYPNPSSEISYNTYFVTSGDDLVLNSDTLPYPITEELVLFKARTYAYEWAEARKDIMAAKGSGANYAMLMKQAEAEFRVRIRSLRLEDRDQVDAYMITLNAAKCRLRDPYYNSQTGRSNMGIGV
jgi:hypothetical protein